MNSGEIDDHILQIYDFKRRLGKGAYGIVWKAVDKKHRNVVAVKKIFDAFRNKTDAQRTYREITFLREFGSHPNVIRLMGVHKACNNIDIYLVFEYMETDLHNVISQGNILQLVHKRYIMYQLLKAAKYIHSGNVIHRDLKPSNILLDSTCRCKVADFGLARSITTVSDDYSEGVDPSLTDYVATRWYRPPEVLVSSKRYTHGIDMWSLGCILAEMLLGKPLFPGSSTVDQVDRIMSTITPPSIEDVRSVCSGGCGVGLLSRQPQRPRRTLREQLRGHGEDALDLATRLLLFNPDKRLSASQALDHSYVRRFRGVEGEPSLSYDILPVFRDDVQLSIDDYRNKLYEIMGYHVKGRSRSAQSHGSSGNNNSPETTYEPPPRRRSPVPVPAAAPAPAPAAAPAPSPAPAPAPAPGRAPLRRTQDSRPQSRPGQGSRARGASHGPGGACGCVGGSSGSVAAGPLAWAGSAGVRHLSDEQLRQQVAQRLGHLPMGSVIPPPHAEGSHAHMHVRGHSHSYSHKAPKQTSQGTNTCHCSSSAATSSSTLGPDSADGPKLNPSNRVQQSNSLKNGTRAHSKIPKAVPARPTTSNPVSMSFNSYPQTHGIVTASALQDLRNNLRR